MKKPLFIFALSLFCVVAQAEQSPLTTLTEISKQAKIMDFDSCKKYVTEATQDYQPQILENNDKLYQLRISTDYASVNISCSRKAYSTIK